MTKIPPPPFRWKCALICPWTQKSMANKIVTDSWSLRRRTWRHLLSGTWKLVLYFTEHPPPILPHAYQNFQKVCVRFNFRTSQDIKFNRSSHATSKKGECKDGHIPTCMLDNKTAIMFSRILTPPPFHTEVLGHQNAWRYWSKPCLCQRTLFCFTGTHG